MAIHPLDQLTVDETNQAREFILKLYPNNVISFRQIFLEEPPKAELKVYLAAEHAGQTPQPLNRKALCQYDVIGSKRVPEYHESIIDLTNQKRLDHVVVDKDVHAGLTVYEYEQIVDACDRSQMFQDAIKEFELPEGFEAMVEPWPYGGLHEGEESLRYFQGLVFAVDKRSGNPDTNFYAFPLPIIPVMDFYKGEICRIDRIATGGKGDALDAVTHNKKVIDHCKPAEYVPELLPNGPRKDLKPINITQPEGPSFTVDGSLVEWQGWRFRLTFCQREGAVLHDVYFKNRSVFYRLSLCEMTVPYADARYPYARKQAFDFGDCGVGSYTNNLNLGCDCLGVIKYFDGIGLNADGTAKVWPNVICLHEQDNGIGWKHTNWRTNRAVVTRHRELVIQFIITEANYEYVFAYKLDLAGSINIETRATGIVSVINIDPGKTSDYGSVVGPGVLAQNHQHIFAVRMDPAIDGHENSVVVEESHPVKMNPKTNPWGNYYEVRHETVTKPCWIDASGKDNRVIKMVNPNKLNPVSQKPVGYKFTPSGTQLLLADPDSLQAKRALFAQHHVWVTRHRDGELYAAGRYTMQSTKEVGGLADAVLRDEKVENDDVVVWNVFGLTHNPRPEDWPVMPVEIHNLHIKPVDFFTENPSIDVPSNRNESATLAHDTGRVNGEVTNGSTTTNGEGACCN